MGSTHFLTKRLPRVSTEMSLHVLAYNFKRVADHGSRTADAGNESIALYRHQTSLRMGLEGSSAVPCAKGARILREGPEIFLSPDGSVLNSVCEALVSETLSYPCGRVKRSW